MAVDVHRRIDRRGKGAVHTPSRRRARLGIHGESDQRMREPERCIAIDEALVDRRVDGVGRHIERSGGDPEGVGIGLRIGRSDQQQGPGLGGQCAKPSLEMRSALRRDGRHDRQQVCTGQLRVRQ